MSYVIYYRIEPKGKKTKGISLETQKAYIKHYFGREYITAEFVETAKNTYMNPIHRPVLYEAIDYCVKNYLPLVVPSIDRISLNKADIMTVYFLLKKRLVSCDIPNLDEESLILFLKLETRKRELISIRTKAALSEKIAKGKAVGNPSNFSDNGRKKGREKQLSNPALRAAKIELKRLCHIYRKQGLSLSEVANKLNTDGYRTSRNNEFKPNTVKRLLDWDYKNY